MKTLSPKGFQMVLPGCVGLVLLSLSQSSAIELTQNALEVHADAARSSAAAPHFSPGISEILKMIDAKVDVEVIKAYIKGSLVAYNPTAGEIIALKDRGVPNDVLTVLIQRGGELRGQQPIPPARQPAMTPPYESGTPDDYGSQPGAPYQASYPDYGYSYPAYSYPSYYSYGYGYPWYSSWYWPYFGFYPYYGSYYGHYYGHYGHYGHGNYHDGHSHGIHASGSSHGAGFSGHGQAWAAAGHNNSHSFAGGTRSFTPMGQTGGFRSGSASAGVARSGMSSFHGGAGGGFRGGVAGSGGGGGFRGGGGGGGGGFHGGGGGFGGGRGR